MQRYGIQVKPRFRQILLVFLVADVVLIALSMGMPFFWDNILTSTLAQYYHETERTLWIAPLQWDAGHPPFFALYISTWWALFGKSLWVSHLAMLPVLWLKTWSLWSLSIGLRFYSLQMRRTLFFFLLCPALLTQSILISYDMVMLAGFLLALSGIFNQSRTQVIAGSLLVLAASVRGMQWLAVLMAIHYLYMGEFTRKRTPARELLQTYVLPVLAILAWYLYHYLQTGWAFLSPSPSWAGHREWSGFSAIFGKMWAILRALLDQGNIALWAGMVLVILFNKRNAPRLRFLVVSTAIAVGLGMLPLLFISSPILPRYAMPVLALLLLIVCGSDLPYRNWALTVIGILLLSGHAWVYSRFSNSWETTFAHAAYHGAREKALDYLAEKRLPPGKVATHFPLYTSRKQTDLRGDTTRLQNLHGSELQAFDYVLYSNIHNDFSKEQKRHLQDWKADTTFRNWWVYITLYRNPDSALAE